MFSFVNISQVIGWEGWVFCTSQETGWEGSLWSVPHCVCDNWLSQYLSASDSILRGWLVVTENYVYKFQK